MKLVFITEARFIKNSQGKIYGEASFNYKLWQRYLTVFSEVIVMARIQQDSNYIGEEKLMSSTEKVSFIELPYFIGPWQYLKVKNKLKKKIKQSITINNAVFICRIPGNIGNMAIKYLAKKKIPFGVEVVGDPWEVFAPKSISHPLRFYFRWQGYYKLKNNLKRASAALYVTNNTLQKRYPVSPTLFQIAASNVKISDSLIVDKPKKHVIKKDYMIISVGSLEQMYKAPDILLKALKIINVQDEVTCKLVWLGDGKFKNQMQELAKELGVSNNVDFKGNVSVEKVREYLLKADIFVLVSRTEGLPRAIIEAMAVGLPCVGSCVGGIPELLEESVLVDKDDANGLMVKIKNLLLSSELYNQQAKRNLLESQKYKESILQNKRTKFYNHLISISS